MPGHGESPRQPRGAGNTPLDQARAVAELLDELGLTSVHVAGNSVGGWVALELGRLQRADDHRPLARWPLGPARAALLSVQRCDSPGSTL
ncbi:MAG: alpha/beta fold hydrolase, partial [Actinoplanes sp.]